MKRPLTLVALAAIAALSLARQASAQSEYDGLISSQAQANGVPVHIRDIASVRVGRLVRIPAAEVRRISLATSLYRAAMTGFLDAARHVRDTGQFAFLDRCVTTSELNQLMRT